MFSEGLKITLTAFQQIIYKLPIKNKVVIEL